jgi:hypothetical protein
VQCVMTCDSACILCTRMNLWKYGRVSGTVQPPLRDWKFELSYATFYLVIFHAFINYVDDGFIADS